MDEEEKAVMSEIDAYYYLLRAVDAYEDEANDSETANKLANEVIDMKRNMSKKAKALGHEKYNAYLRDGSTINFSMEKTME